MAEQNQTPTPTPETPSAEGSGVAPKFNPNDPVEMFRMDPFELIKEFQPQEPPESAAGTPAGGGTTSPAAVPPNPAGTSPADVGNQQPNLAEQLAVMKAQMDQMTRLFQQPQTAQQPQPQGQPGGQPPAAPQGPNFMYTVPPQIINMLKSEDPAEFSQALSVLLAGIAQQTYRESTTRFQQELESFRPYVENTVAQRLQQYQIYTDFYGPNPDLAAPQFRSVVQNTFAEMANKPGFTGWNYGFRDQLAKEVRKRLGWPEAGQAAPAPTPNQLPPRTLGNGQRVAGAAPNSENSQQRQMENMFDELF